jgi:uncharacterized protein (TIGR04255 family)
MRRQPRPPDLPNFGKPPVTEVALSVQFDTIAPLGNIHAGLLWAEYRSEYPKVSELPALPPQFETFGGGGAPTTVPFQFETLLQAPMSRFWFEEAGGEHLMQIQNDRIVHNWRKRETEGEYPRYEPIADRLEGEIGKFEEFLQREKLGQLRANQCEVTYINTIELLDGGDPHRHIERITPLWSGFVEGDRSLEPENVATQIRYVLKNDGTSIGRVYVNFSSVFRIPDQTHGVQLSITVRARPQEPHIEAALGLLDREREILVRTFAAVTTEEMHRLWERTDG